MSQSETYMLIILGFAIATLIALVIGRLAWKLALRLGAKRSMRNIPSTVAELQTDRDRLRADHAMMATKLEYHLEDMKMRSAEQEAEVSRHRNRFETFTQDIARRDAEIAELKKSVVELETAQAENVRMIVFLKSNLTAKEAEISALKNPTLMTEAPPKFDETPTQERLQSRISELTTISNQMSKQRESEIGEAPKPSNGILIKPAGSTEFQTEIRPEKEKPVEHAAAQLQSELKRLDEAWSEETPDMAPDQPAETSPRRGITNVISLAQRIKALQKTIVN
jgi:hypothetical protein